MSEFLYKFIPFGGDPNGEVRLEQIFLDGVVFAASIDKLNDPLEMAINTNSTGPGLPENQIDRRIRAISIAMKNKDTGIVSFTKNFDSITMWSHYADQHRGFCVRLKPALVKVHEFAEVRYSSHLPISESEFDIAPLLTKSLDWTYEQEFRIISKGASNQLISLGKNAFDGLYFGLRTKKEDRLRIIENLSAINPSISFFEMMKPVEKYELGCSPTSADHVRSEIARLAALRKLAALHGPK